MKITNITYDCVEVPFPQEFHPTWYPGKTEKGQVIFVVRVHTDEGITGYSCMEAPHGILPIVCDTMEYAKSFVVGDDPCDIEKIMLKFRNVARIAKGFGMEIYAFDAYCPKELIEADGVIPVNTPEELYEKCNIVSIHIPATPGTRMSINYNLLNRMPKNGLIVNTARKEVINEIELVKVMEDRPDLKYVTDIMPDDHKELSEKFAGRYFTTPKKMGAQTAEANINAGIAAAKQIVGFLKDGCEKFRVNK